MSLGHSKSLSMSQAAAPRAEAAGATFDVYGYQFSTRGTARDAIDGIREDFAFFQADGATSNVELELLDENPPYGLVPPVDASVYTPRNVAYRSGTTRYIDYHGRALGIQDEVTGNMKFYSRDQNLLYEATYLYLIAQVGAFLDQRGLHRMHALGVTVNGKAVLVMLPMGGGKSTLGMHLLQHPEVHLLSDDSPIIDRKGRVLAYPLRLGLLPGMESAVPAQHRRVIQRMEFGPKHLINYSYFQDRVIDSAEPALVMIGARTFAPGCRIEEVSLAAGLRACIPHCVVGMGLFHGLEFILRASGWEILKKSGTGMSRLRNCWELLRRSQVCRIHLGPDAKANARAVVEHAMAIQKV
jgi:hypothetical protein